MTETQYRQKSVRQALNTMYEKAPEGNHRRRLDALAALISGIVGSKSCQLSHCASRCGGESKTASRERYLERFVGNKWVDTATYYLPCLVQVIAKVVALARQKGAPLYIIIDSTKSGSCTTWLFSLAWKKRSIPLCWRVLKQKKGHAPQGLPCELLDEVYALLPQDIPVVVLGDGEFDTCAFQSAVIDKGWSYVVRTAKDLTITYHEESFRFDSLAPPQGESTFWLDAVALTKQQLLSSDSVNALVWHERRYKDPLYLLTNLETAPEAVEAYGKRFLIETLFSDIKSRGFGFQKTRLKAPENIHRLLLAVALAYLWILWLGKKAIDDPYYRKFLHRSDRLDWSCFRFGYELLQEYHRSGIEKLQVCFVWDS
jgi:hypothetical protein